MSAYVRSSVLWIGHHGLRMCSLHSPAVTSLGIRHSCGLWPFTLWSHYVDGSRLSLFSLKFSDFQKRKIKISFFQNVTFITAVQPAWTHAQEQAHSNSLQAYWWSIIIKKLIPAPLQLLLHIFIYLLFGHNLSLSHIHSLTHTCIHIDMYVYVWVALRIRWDMYDIELTDRRRYVCLSFLSARAFWIHCFVFAVWWPVCWCHWV